MPDSDKILSVLIQLGVVGQQDVKAATDLLKENFTATIAGGEATKDLNAKTEDAAQSVKLFNVHSEEFNQLIGKLNRFLPGLGLALKAAFNPENIGISTVVTITTLLTEYFKRLHDEALKVAEDMASNFIAVQNGIKDAQTAADEFKEHLEKANEPVEHLKTKFTEQKTLLEELLKAHRDILKEMEKQELAAAGKNEAEKNAIQKRYEDLNRSQDLKDENTRLNQLDNQLVAAMKNRDAMAKRAQDAEAALEAAQKTTPQEAKNEADFNRMGGAAGEGKIKADAAAAKGRGEIDFTYDLYLGLKAAVEQRDKDLKKLAEDVKTAEKERDDAQGQVSSLGTELDTGRRSQGIHKQGAADIATVDKTGLLPEVVAAKQQLEEQNKLLLQAHRDLLQAQARHNLETQRAVYEAREAIDEAAGNMKQLAEDIRAAAQITKSLGKLGGV